MSCPNSKAPIDIPNFSKNICVEKCNLVYKYGDSSTTIANKGDHLSLGYDASNTNIYYNTIKMEVQDIRIYTPSLHSYNGKRAEAELIIIHSGFGKNLLLCIPIKSSGPDTLSILDTIIDNASSKITNKGDAAALNSFTWNLNNIVPHQKQVYTYTSTLPYVPCSGTYDYLVWNINDYFIPVSTKFISILKGKHKIISSHKYTIQNGPTVFINKKGATNSSYASDNDDIYIECQPTGEENTLEYSTIQPTSSTSTSSSSTTSPQDILENPVVEIMIGLIAAMIVFKTGEYVYHKMKNN